MLRDGAGIFDYEREGYFPLRSPRPVALASIEDRKRWKQIERACEGMHEVRPVCAACGERIVASGVEDVESSGERVYHVGCFRRLAENLRGALSR